MVAIDGSVEPGFGKVADVFAANFEYEGDVGAAVCVHLDGRRVVDLWGGVANRDTGDPYTADTLQLVFSTTKGATAICANMLIERGAIDVDAPVATYWPEFAAAGKDRLPVRYLLTHQAGLHRFDRKVTVDDVVAVTPVVEALAAQAPYWEPGSAHGYHGFTYGWLVGEVVRRVTGRSLGTWFAEEVAAPLGLDFWIGLPESEEKRVSPLIDSPPPDDPEIAALMMQMMGPESELFRVITVDGALPVATPGEPMWFNSREAHATEMPAANGITTARSLSRLYAATIGEVDGVRLLKPKSIEIATTPQTSGVDRVLAIETKFGLGFLLHSDATPLLGPHSFGHAGAGGSLGFADPDSGVAFGYVMNQMKAGLNNDPRAAALVESVRLSIR